MARVARVQAGGANTKGTIFVGQDEQHHLGQTTRNSPGKAAGAAGNALYPLSLLGAFVLGLFAVALGIYARFQLMAGQAVLEDASIEMALSGGIGLMLSFVLAQMFRLTSKEHKAMQAAGVFVMVCGFHNLAHWLPGPMTLLFSPAHVVEMQVTSPANSARIGGSYFPLFATGAPEQGTADGLAACPPDAPKPDVAVLQTMHAGKASKSGHKTVSAAPASEPCASP